jgi:transposase
MILPPSIDEYVGPRHRVRVIVEVVEQLDLSGFHVGEAGEGRPAYPAEILVSLLFYAFSIGVFSAREMERRCQTDCAFMFATAGERPSHRSISRFRAIHQEELSGLFVQIVRVCRRAGLGNTARVAIDGTRQHANASIDAHVRKEQLEKELGKIQQDMKKLLDRAAEVDAEEERDPERASNDDVVPEELEKKERRARAIEAAVKELEEANVAAPEAGPRATEEEAKKEPPGASEEWRQNSLAEKRKRKEEIDQSLRQLEQSGQQEANDSDPDARLQRFKEGSRPGFNAQIAVSGEDKLILAAEVTPDAGDKNQLIAMLDQIESNTGEKPGVITTDSGYESGENYAQLAARDQDAVIASACTIGAHKVRERTGLFQWVDFRYDAERDEYLCPAGRRLVRVGSQPTADKPKATYEAADPCTGCPLKARCTKWEKRILSVLETTRFVLAMSQRRDRDRRTDRFGALRKVDVEPRFGHMKHNLRWKQFMRRGLVACRSEFRILCGAINLSALARWLGSRGLAVSQIPAS